MKIISTISIFNDTEEKNIYKKSGILIPFIVIFFLVISFLRSYVTYKIKQIFHEKFITISGFLLLYNAFGFILSLISSIFPNLFPCNDNHGLKEFICKIQDEESIYYYDSYSIFFNRTKEKILKYIFFFLLKITFDFFINLFSLYTIYKLDPTYYICSSSIYYFFYRLAKLIISDENVKVRTIFEFLAELFSFIGILVYLEFIELNCFELNKNLKRNIVDRSSLIDEPQFQNELGEEFKEEEDDNGNANGNENGNENENKAMN